MPGPMLMIDGILSPAVILQQLSVLIWLLPLVPATFAGHTAGPAYSECNAIWVGSVTAASPGRRKRHLGAPRGLNFTAGEWFRTLSPIEPVIVRVMSFGAQKAIQGAEFAGALTKYF
jgi:hypothetical protein